MKTSFILTLYQQAQTVFTFKELILIFPQLSLQSLKNKIHYVIRTEKLLNPRKGVYVKKKYQFLELANKVYTPSYISLETVLNKEGIIFQEYQTVFLISYLSRKINIAGREIFYRRIKDQVLYDTTGINKIDNYFMASKERAFLDAIFLYKNYHFDSLRNIDWFQVDRLKTIYASKILEKRVAQYYQIYKEENVR